MYGELAVSVLPVNTPRAVPKDTDDDHVIACALAAHADLILSGDNDLLELERYQGIRIVTPTMALTLIAEGPRSS